MPSLTLLKKPEPLLPQVVAFLIGNGEENFRDALLDLSNTVIVLPTQEARRRLHESLVRNAASRNAALLPPHWRLPMQLAEGGARRSAPTAVEQLYWIQVLQQMKESESRLLFPKKQPSLDPTQAAELAGQINKLRGELAQAGMSLSEAATKRPEDLRWRALVSLEQRVLTSMSEAGWHDKIMLQLEGAQQPVLPQGTRRIVIAGVPDLPRIYEMMIPRIEAQGVSVEILTYDPAGKGTRFFDELGRPSESWSKVPIPIDRSSIHLCLDRAEEIEKTALLAKASGGTGRTCAVAVTTTELAQPVQDALEGLYIPAFNPAGESLAMLPIGRLLRTLLLHLRESDFPSALQLLRHPVIQQWLGLDALRDLTILDDLQNQLIPASLDDLLARWPESSDTDWEKLKEGLERLQSLVLQLKQGQGTAPLRHTLRTIYSTTDLAQIPGGTECVETIMEWLSVSEALMAPMSSEDLLNLLLAHLQSAICTGEKESNAVEIPGWLELLWEDAPHLIVTGMNDGLVPETTPSEPFLYEKLRAVWGLPSEETRLRRDSYFLNCILAGRISNQKHTGRVDLLLARHDDEAAVLKPSRLLFRCAEDAELPALVQDLFRELPPRSGEKWQAAWALRPERKTAKKTISASAIKDYLACPTRFYLKRVLGLRSESFGAEEADATTFGNLLHDTLRVFGTDPKLRNLSDADHIERTLLGIWKELFDARYGTQPSFPLLYQREVGIRRLRGAALAQAAIRAEGWEIVACETKFRGFPVGEMELSGQIDRIDRRATKRGTEWRILDYKSSEKEKNPDAEHYRGFLKRDDRERFAPYECFTIKEKPHHWIDLQLPIYRMILLAEMERSHSEFLSLPGITTGSVEVGYFILPSKIAQTEFIPFAALDELSGSADACLRGVIDSIRNGIFWPPRQPKYDEFEDLLFNHLEAKDQCQQTLDPEMLKGER